MRSSACKECGNEPPITKNGMMPAECAVCHHVLCDHCALVNVDGEATAISLEECTDTERQTYNAFCEEHDGRAPFRRAP